MKLTLILLLSSQVSFAGSAKETYGKWLTFKSNLGFSFEYPECFDLKIGSYDDGDVLADSPSINM